MLIKIVEIISCTVSLAAFVYGASELFKKGVPEYFSLHACAAGCFLLEELWVIVNSLFGNGGDDGLVTVRLIGFFGCLCFMLSANGKIFDSVVDEGDDLKASYIALAAPAGLTALFVIYALSPLNSASISTLFLGFASLSPAIFASYYNLKHLLLREDSMGFLEITKAVSIFSLLFYGANFIYSIADLYASRVFMSFYDLLLSCMVFVLMILCRKGALEWKTRI